MTHFDTALQHIGTATTTWLDKWLQPATPEAISLLNAMRHMALAPGKRFRPFLVVQSAALFGIPLEKALPTAAAIECLHAFSLIHDDLPAMDNSPLRRGLPTCHIAFGEAMAILAGDALQTEAFAILSNPVTSPDASTRCQLIAGLASASGSNGMVLGQALDMEAEKGGFTLTAMEQMQRLKTGALIAFSAESGAILAKADSTSRNALRTYGEALGLLFQVTDDILDATSTPEKLGKTTGHDAVSGKATFVALQGMDGAKAMATRLQQQAHDALNTLPASSPLLAAAIDYITTRQQ
jgi:farnesyl diphosphate synthase